MRSKWRRDGRIFINNSQEKRIEREFQTNMCEFIRALMLYLTVQIDLYLGMTLVTVVNTVKHMNRKRSMETNQINLHQAVSEDSSYPKS